MKRAGAMTGVRNFFWGAACLAAGGVLQASGLEEARQALADGLPQVAVHRLVQADKKWPDAAGQTAADLLLGEALIAAGRYQESVDRLSRLAAGEPAGKFWLAEAYAALGQPEKALPLYKALAADREFASRAVVGEARMLQQLWRSGEALDLLRSRAREAPDDKLVALELAEQSLDAGDAATADAALKRVPGRSPEAAYLRGRVLLAQGDPASALSVLDAMTVCPARFAAGRDIARAECEMRLKEPADAEKILESFIEEKASLPGLPEVFAALDRVYAAQTSASNTELRRWSGDASNALRSGYALFYLARNEARAGNAERSRQLYADFLSKYPGNPLGLDARVELAGSFLESGDPAQALAILESDSGGRASFLRGKAQNALGDDKEAGASFLDAADVPSLEREALFNSALCFMLAGATEDQNEGAARLAALPGGAPLSARFEFFSAMHAAARRDPDAGRRLGEIAATDSPYAAQARLALAEWDALRLDYAAAGAELRRISTQAGQAPALEERASALAVFVADTGEPNAEAEVKRLAAGFLKAYPDSAFAPEIHMKLGEMYFRRGDYLAARGEFVAVAEKFPDSSLAEKANFLTARAMERSMDHQTMLEAIAIYETVAGAGGPLASRARLAQALLFNALKQPNDALGVFDKILESKPDAELRNTALIEAGKTLFALGAEDPANFQRAIGMWKQVADDPAAPRLWTNQAWFLIGEGYEKLNQPDAALDAYYTVISRGPRDDAAGAEPEYFWYYKSGFEAGTLLEDRKLWKEAIAVYEKISAIDGPRAGEAADRINKLRLANFIWED
jgi:TolA-binding protein